MSENVKPANIGEQKKGLPELYVYMDPFCPNILYIFIIILTLAPNSIISTAFVRSSFVALKQSGKIGTGLKRR